MHRPLLPQRSPNACLLIALALAAAMCAAPSAMSAAIGIAAVVLATLGGFFAGHDGFAGVASSGVTATSCADGAGLAGERTRSGLADGFDGVARLRLGSAVARLRVTPPR